MATISTSGISIGQIIRSEHLLRIINALNGTTPIDIIISGSITGSLFGTSSWANHALTASYVLGGGGAGPISVTGSTLYSNSPAAGLGFNRTESIFFGTGSGNNATLAHNSIFLGSYSGQNASSAQNAIFIGELAGTNATNVNYSNFIGSAAGLNATDVIYSNFFGLYAGNSATNASNSNFLGYQAGNYASSASFSTLIGFQVGYDSTLGSKSIGSNNIIIGTNITLPAQQKDSINLGGIIFATGSYSTTSGTPFSGSVSNAKVGIGTSTPAYTLDVSGSTRINDILILEPRTTTPASPTNGMVIVSGSGVGQHIYCYLNSTWKQLD